MNKKIETEIEKKYSVESSESGTHLDDDIRQKDLIKATVTALKNNDFLVIPKLLQHLHEADLADVFKLLDGNHRKTLAKILEDTLEPDVLAELEGAAREDVIGAMETSKVAEALSQMEIDDAVEVLMEMESGEQQEILGHIHQDDRAHIEEGLSYPEDSAGRMMQRDLVAVPPYWTVGQTIDSLRGNEGLPG
ncbi:MAG: magnesium transporter MgtE N-terminal domain-containing protein, partial [Sphingomonadales bacterium]